METAFTLEELKLITEALETWVTSESSNAMLGSLVLSAKGGMSGPQASFAQAEHDSAKTRKAAMRKTLPIRRKLLLIQEILLDEADLGDAVDDAMNS